MNQAVAIISFLFILFALFWNYEEDKSKKQTSSGKGGGLLGSLLAFSVIVPSLVIGGMAFVIGKLLHLLFLLLSTIAEALWEMAKRFLPTLKKLLRAGWELGMDLLRVLKKAGRFLWKSFKTILRSGFAFSRILRNVFALLGRMVRNGLALMRRILRALLKIVGSTIRMVRSAFRFCVDTIRKAWKGLMRSAKMLMESGRLSGKALRGMKRFFARIGRMIKAMLRRIVRTFPWLLLLFRLALRDADSAENEEEREEKKREKNDGTRWSALLFWFLPERRESDKQERADGRMQAGFMQEEEEELRWARGDEDIMRTLRRIGWATRRGMYRHDW